jgi:hypothetical protein
MKKMKNKKIFWIIFIVAMAVFTFIIVLRMDEDSWIKSNNGVWIKHGNPIKTPSEVTEQKQIIACATDIYFQFKINGMIFSSQCLGTCEDYAIDIVHVPRIGEDDNSKNQCEDYLNGKLKHFIELDTEGKVVRIV